ncbi:UNVERIFIED_CONTAM: hypothetical protein RF648_19890, partial [Kocuria sp. CPCC 205274]
FSGLNKMKAYLLQYYNSQTTSSIENKWFKSVKLIDIFECINFNFPAVTKLTEIEVPDTWIPDGGWEDNRVRGLRDVFNTVLNGELAQQNWVDAGYNLNDPDDKRSIIDEVLSNFLKTRVAEGIDVQHILCDVKQFFI